MQQWLRGIERIAPPLDHCPQELEEQSAHLNGKINRPKFSYTYAEYLERDLRRKAKLKEICTHTRIAIICLECGTHFEATKHKPAAARVTFI